MVSCNLFLIWCHTELMTRFIYVVGPILTRWASGFCASMIKWEEEYTVSHTSTKQLADLPGNK